MQEPALSEALPHSPSADDGDAMGSKARHTPPPSATCPGGQRLPYRHSERSGLVFSVSVALSLLSSEGHWGFERANVRPHQSPWNRQVSSLP